MKLKMNYNWGHKLILLVVSMICTVSSCNTITEFPDDEAIDPTLININLKISISPDVSNMTNTSAFNENVKQRIVVEAYRFNNQTQPEIRKEIVLDKPLDKQETSINLSLNATKYRIVAWSDYIQTKDASDMYYYTVETLRKIKYNGEYTANKEEKDCFSNHKDIDLTQYSDVWNMTINMDMQLDRPVGKLTLISNDIEKYISKINSKGETISKADINSFTAKIIYSGYTPNGYDAYENKLNDASIGISYYSKFNIINENEAMVAFDYVLADIEGTQYNITMQIFDKDGKIVNEVSGNKVFVFSNKETILKTNFLTGEYKPGINIDQGYDGVIDVIIPD